MNTLILFFIAALFGIFFTTKVSEAPYHNGYFFGLIVSFMATGVLFIVCCLGTAHSTDFPVEYKVFPTDTEIICYVGNKRYISDKKKDFDTWSQNKPGFVRKGYNHFGVEISDNFITK